MEQSGIYWVTPPERLAEAIDAYGKRVLIAVLAVAVQFGRIAADESRRNAIWQDRTGNARSGLYYAVDGLGAAPIIGEVDQGALELTGGDIEMLAAGDNEVIVALSHTVWYGKFLEIGMGGRYAIIMSTIEANLPRLEQMLAELFVG